MKKAELRGTAIVIAKTVLKCNASMPFNDVYWALGCWAIENAHGNVARYLDTMTPSEMKNLRRDWNKKVQGR